MPDLIGHNDKVRCLNYSHDGKYIASGSNDNSIKIWESSNLEEIKCLLGHVDYVLSVCFSADGKLILSSSFDQTIIIWNLQTEA